MEILPQEIIHPQIKSKFPGKLLVKSSGDYKIRILLIIHGDFKMVLTTQRKAIIEELKKLKTHPTADQFYEVMRRKTPKISIASVYRNLEVLSSAGMIAKLEVSGTQNRFDGDISMHYHLKCSKCGGFVDFSPKGSKTLSKSLDKVKELNMNIDNFNIVFNGLCDKCK
jgi:Fur family ferric uptake transcriptional regulator